ncbi:MAG: hypothetical protein EOP05_12785, partial [Proteobacteria bacterium]
MHSVPGKTFLLGEHVATDGGPSILVSTNPRFDLFTNSRKSLQGSAPAHPFNEHSPAGKFFDRHAKDLEEFSFEFKDEHVGKGGLGASSAQFILLMAEWRRVTTGSSALGG